MAEAKGRRAAAAADFVSKIVKDPKQPPNTLLLKGYLGASSEEGHTRLYLDPQLSDYVEIPDDAILHTQEIADEQSPLGGSYVWIQRDAEIVHGSVGSNRLKAKFLEGRIYQEYMKGAQFSGGGVQGIPISGPECHLAPPTPGFPRCNFPPPPSWFPQQCITNPAFPPCNIQRTPFCPPPTPNSPQCPSGPSACCWPPTPNSPLCPTNFGPPSQCGPCETPVQPCFTPGFPQCQSIGSPQCPTNPRIDCLPTLPSQCGPCQTPFSPCPTNPLIDCLPPSQLPQQCITNPAFPPCNFPPRTSFPPCPVTLPGTPQCEPIPVNSRIIPCDTFICRIPGTVPEPGPLANAGGFVQTLPLICPPTQFPPQCPPTQFPPQCPPSQFPPQCPPSQFPPQCPPSQFPPQCPPSQFPPQCPPTQFPPQCPPSQFPPQCPPSQFPPLCPPSQFPPQCPPTPFGPICPPSQFPPLCPPSQFPPQCPPSQFPPQCPPSQFPPQCFVTLPGTPQCQPVTIRGCPSAVDACPSALGCGFPGGNWGGGFR